MSIVRETESGPRYRHGDRPTHLNPNPSLKEDTGYPPRVTATPPPGHLVEPATVQQLAELLADHDHHDRRAEQAYRDGYTDGFTSGWDVGYGHAHEEIAAHWVALAARIRGYANSPTFEELQRRRAQPGGLIYERAVARRGQTQESV